MKNIQFIILALLISSLSFSQPRQVLDINNSGTLGSFPINLFVHDGLLYFSADDSSGSNSPGNLDLGREIWISDGTNIGTSFLKDLNNGSLNSFPNNFFAFNSNLYFSANSGAGDVLFTSDGTEGGTITTGVEKIEIPIESGGLIYNINDSNKRLYAFNGVSNTPVVGSGDEYIQGNQLIAFNNKIFCYMNTSGEIGTTGTELYAYDPSIDTFSLIENIGGGSLESEITYLTVLDSHLYFSAFSGTELWRSDGTGVGTELVSSANGISGLSNIYAWNGKLFFEGDDGSSDQLWVYNPIDDSVTNLSNLTGTAPNHDPSDYAPLNGWLYYRGEDSNDNNGHLWRTNGTETFQLDDIIINVDELVVLNNKLYFEGSNGSDGNELFEFNPATLSINSFLNNRVDIYPNPTSKYVNIKSNIAIKKIEIHDFLGKRVLSTQIQNQIDMSKFQSGMYLIKIYSEKGDITKRIVVK